MHMSFKSKIKFSRDMILKSTKKNFLVDLSGKQIDPVREGA